MSADSTMGRWRITLIAAVLVALIGLLVAAVARGDERAMRLDRKMRVMEKVLDEVLVQSPHVRVGMSGETTGLVADDYGAIFVFRGELGANLEQTPDFQVLLKSIQEAAERDEDSPPPSDKASPGRKTLDQLKKEVDAKRRGELTALRTELVDTLLDYGPTLAELGDERWVMVVGVLGGGIFDEHELGGGRTTLVVKVRIRDLRQLAAGTLTREAAAAKFVVETK